MTDHPPFLDDPDGFGGSGRGDDERQRNQEAARRAAARRQQERRSLQLEERAVRRLLSTLSLDGLVREILADTRRRLGRAQVSFSALRRLRPDMPVHLEVVRLLHLGRLGLADVLSPAVVEKSRWYAALAAASDHAGGDTAGVVFGPLKGIPGGLLVAHTTCSSLTSGISACRLVFTTKGLDGTLEPFESWVDSTLRKAWRQAL